MNKKQAFNIAVQSGAARDFALMKANKQFKKPKRDKVPYNPFKRSLGLSQVSQAIMDKFARPESRRERKRLAKLWGESFTAHYNGEGPQRVHHDARPSRYAGRG